ncbi:peptide chain release factor N(5)-glutamine methyltransferase [Rudanella paleaurantiibacter]|uniref:Peptide chain release factor N(5)-glutamine methyltransferase n=1 Tax=Rudanella paleaurantiibacter TaxID=2614655 RepID=A0A7J5U2W9_9BACT|nr:peptide chain release factor N(5)-glutamine methyltransferase [Rudanella paleaurantiibacter]KAB7731344.1 peptide chain release factor N(5)-glutamine methyltransferase [Rudanella paleaurantiibacter]
MATARPLYQQLSRNITAYPPEEAREMAFMLLDHYFGFRKADVLGDKPLPPNRTEPDWFRILERLNRQEPIQHVIGTTIFCGLEFEVSPDVLIPRPETEDLVRLIMHDFANRIDDPLEARPVEVLDIGTGSGCLAVTLARFLPSALVTGWDVSEQALTLARRNAENLGAADVVFQIQDILNVPAGFDRSFDCIVSNPPYVTRSEAAQMDRNVLEYEPDLALFVDDADPLIFYKAVADFARKHLTPGGACYVEINERFGDDTRRVFADRGFTSVQVYKDIHGKDRSVRASL